jgi:hypothetical protein
MELRVARKRTAADRMIVRGKTRSFEWFWSADDTMPGLDAFELLDADAQAAMIALLRHWADLPHGARVSETRIAEEHDEPKIVAVKVGTHRFTVFHGGRSRWVVHRYYSKRKRKLDKLGRSIVKTTIAAMRDYEERLRRGTYHERT